MSAAFVDDDEDFTILDDIDDLQFIDDLDIENEPAPLSISSGTEIDQTKACTEEISKQETSGHCIDNLEVHVKVEKDEKQEDQATNLNDTSVAEDQPCEEDQKAGVIIHPYQYLIDTFEVPKELLTVTTVETVKTLDETPVYIVNNKSVLIRMLQTLRSAKEIGLDIQFSPNEYQHEICLVEISTRDADYIIDVIKLRSHILLLTEILINPRIVKIVSRLERLLVHLQQDLGLYIINLFDAEKVMAAALVDRRSTINYALKEKYSITRDNTLCMTDFRIRPLSDSVKTFCRSIPHYLVYIYHEFKNKLLISDENLYRKLLGEFHDACKVMYFSQIAFLIKCLKKDLVDWQNCEVDVLRKLYKWRNDIAKKMHADPEDVLPQADLFRVATTLPGDETTLNSVLISSFLKEAKLSEEVTNLITNSKQSFKIKINTIKETKNESKTSRWGKVQDKRSPPQKKQKRFEQVHTHFSTTLKETEIKKIRQQVIRSLSRQAAARERQTRVSKPNRPNLPVWQRQLQITNDLLTDADMKCLNTNINESIPLVPLNFLTNVNRNELLRSTNALNAQNTLSQPLSLGFNNSNIRDNQFQSSVSPSGACSTSQQRIRFSPNSNINQFEPPNNTTNDGQDRAFQSPSGFNSAYFGNDQFYTQRNSTTRSNASGKRFQSAPRSSRFNNRLQTKNNGRNEFSRGVDRNSYSGSSSQSRFSADSNSSMNKSPKNLQGTRNNLPGQMRNYQSDNRNRGDIQTTSASSFPMRNDHRKKYISEIDEKINNLERKVSHFVHHQHSGNNSRNGNEDPWRRGF